MPNIPLSVIAKRVGCTRSAVSYALRDHPTISVKLREKIKAAARELGWVPDAELQRQMALVRSTTKRKDLPNLGVIINRDRGLFARLPTLGKHLSGVMTRAADLGFGIDLFSLIEDPMSEKRLEEVMHARGIRGVILVDVDVTTDEELLKVAEQFATVMVGIVPGRRLVHSVTADYMALGRRTMLELHKLGFRRPGVTIPRGVEMLVQWSFSGGLQAGLAQFDDMAKIPFLYTKEPYVNFPIVEIPAMREWYFTHKPDCIVSLDTVTMAALLRVTPDSNETKLPIFSLDYHEGEGACGGIEQNSYDIGVAGVDLVVSLLDRGHTGLPTIPRVVAVREAWVPPTKEVRYSELCKRRQEYVRGLTF